MLTVGAVKSVSKETETGAAALPAASDTCTTNACVAGASPTPARKSASAACGTVTAQILPPAPADTVPV